MVELLALSKTYPIITMIIALVLFILGFKVAKKLFWVLAGLAVVATVVMMFL